LSTWEEYHTGVLYLSYFSGPVEGVLLIIGTMILTGILGPSIWLTTIQELFGLDDATSEIATKGQLNHIMVILSAITLLYNILSSIYNAVKAKKHSRKDLTYTLLGLVPYFAGSALAYLWLLASPTILTEYLVPFMLYTGITLGYIVGQIILAHVTDSKFPFFSIVYIPLVLGVINAAFPALFDVEIIPTSHEYIYVYVCLGIAVLIYAHFAYSVIREICNFLDIYCLRIKPKPRDETKMV
jgi:ethanolaminephosphotransferase